MSGHLEPLQVTLDIFQTDTADYADYVLPAASFLEFDDVVMSYFNHSVSAQVAAVEAPGEALPNQEIFRRLAKALGLEDSELYETDHQIIGKILNQAKPGLTFEALKTKGTISIPDEPSVQFADLCFKTPSGKIELTGDRYVAAGLPSTPHPFAEARPHGGQFRLLSPASEWLMNSSYANDKKVVRRLKSIEAWMNPLDAASLNIKDGTRVTLENNVGSIELTIASSVTVPSGVILAPKGRWPKNTATGMNINVLNPGHKSDLAESCAVHSINVTLSRAPSRELCRVVPAGAHQNILHGLFTRRRQLQYAILHDYLRAVG